MVKENLDSDQLDINHIKNNFKMKKNKLKILNIEKSENPGVFMLRKDYFLSSLLAKRKLNLIGQEENFIIDITKKFDSKKLQKGLIVEKISEPNQNRNLNLPFISENENKIKILNSRTLSKNVYDFKTLITLNKLHRRQLDSGNITIINTDHIIKLNPLEDTVQYKLSKNKDSPSYKSSDKIKINTFNNFTSKNYNSQNLPAKDLFVSKSIIPHLTNDNIFKTSINFGMHVKSNFKSRAPTSKTLYHKKFLKTTSGW